MLQLIADKRQSSVRGNSLKSAEPSNDELKAWYLDCTRNQGQRVSPYRAVRRASVVWRKLKGVGLYV